MAGRDVWSARVRGGGGRFEWARLSIEESGDVVLETGSDSLGSSDRAVIEHEDAVRLGEVLGDELGA